MQAPWYGHQVQRLPQLRELDISYCPLPTRMLADILARATHLEVGHCISIKIRLHWAVVKLLLFWKGSGNYALQSRTAQHLDAACLSCL